jgi:hypothetical protein
MTYYRNYVKKIRVESISGFCNPAIWLDAEPLFSGGMTAGLPERYPIGLRHSTMAGQHAHMGHSQPEQRWLPREPKPTTPERTGQHESRQEVDAHDHRNRACPCASSNTTAGFLAPGTVPAADDDSIVDFGSAQPE